jgi:hypothetical protein
MKSKKIITGFLILVMVLQLLPVRQAVRYFLIDNQTVEEILPLEKGATKNFSYLDEGQQMMQELFSLTHHFTIINNSYPLQVAENVPLFHPADIPTPPPDNV